MAVATILGYNFIHYITLSNTIATLSSIGIAFLTYIVCTVNLGILNNYEIMELPYGNKICKIVKKIKKV